MSSSIDFQGFASRYGLFLVLALNCACTPPAETPTPPRPALVMQVELGDDTTSTGFIGEIRARYESAQSFRIDGKVRKRWVETGQRVQRGQRLIELDPLDNQLASQAAQAQVREAQAQVTLDRAELERMQKLRERQFVSQQALDIQQARYQATVAKLQQVQAQAKVTENQNQYTQLNAERDGVITAVHAEPGQVVRAGEVLINIAVPEQKEVALAIPESRMGGIQLESKAQIVLWANTTTIYNGHVREIAPAADSATRTFQTRVAIDDHTDDLRLGMTARVRFLAHTPERVLLPTPAVSQRDGQTVVWVVNQQHRVEPRPVTIGDYREDGVIVKSGLQTGETVVIAGVHALIPGMQVKPQLAEHPL